MSDLQAAAERWEKHQYAKGGKGCEKSPYSDNFAKQIADEKMLMTYGARCATLVPQLVAALKAARGFIASTSHSVTGIERQIDAAIAAGEGR